MKKMFSAVVVCLCISMASPVLYVFVEREANRHYEVIPFYDIPTQPIRPSDQANK